MKKRFLVLLVLIVAVAVLTACSPQIGPQGPQGVQGPAGPQGVQGPAVDVAELVNNPDFVASLKETLVKPGVDNPYMKVYQDLVEYKVPDGMVVPSNLLTGFTPVPSLVLTDLKLPSGYKVTVPSPPEDVADYKCFPQDYSEGDLFNRGCKDLQEKHELPWAQPLAGFNDSENWSCDSPDGWCADDVQALDWRVITGFEVCHPAIGCIKDPDGGAAMIEILNFHDSDEVWGPRNGSAVYVDSGFIGYGRFFDFSGSTYDVGFGVASLRNHFLYNLSSPVDGDNKFSGQCGDSGLCETVTYVIVFRVWDRPEIGINYSHFELIDYGQWVRPIPTN